ncbi:MAG: DUF4253 domain-containing protein [Phycisphaerales bacterium]
MTSNEIATRLSSAGIKVPALSERLNRNPEPLVGFDIDSASAIKTWRELRQRTGQTGLYPVIVSDQHDLLGLTGAEAPSAADILKEAAGIDGAKRLQRLAAENEGAGEGDEEGEAERIAEFTVPWNLLDGKPRDDLSLVLLPTTRAWEACAYLAFEAVNFDISSDAHVAVHKYWHEQYGAELVTCGGDVLEFTVARPPRAEAAAAKLAREQFAYCPDLVEQGVGSLGALTRILVGGNIWYFWWD